MKSILIILSILILLVSNGWSFVPTGGGSAPINCTNTQVLGGTPSGVGIECQTDTGAGAGDLLADGTIPLTANWDVGAFTITGTQFISDIAGGTAPFVVTSTTVVANLNSATSVLAATVTVTDDEATNDAHEVVFTTDNVTLESDGTFNYNPSTGTVTATTFAGTVSLATLASTVTAADTTDATSFVALFESVTGNQGVKTDLGITYAADTGILTATGFAGDITGAVTGNASTATALAGDPTDCAGDTFAQSIVASGNLTCSSIASTDLSDNGQGSASDNEIIFANGATVDGVPDLTYDDTHLLIGGTAGTTRLQFRDATEYIASLTNGSIDAVVDTAFHVNNGKLTVDSNIELGDGTASDFKITFLADGTDGIITWDESEDNWVFNGTLTASVFESTAADRQHYVNASNTTSPNYTHADGDMYCTTALDICYLTNGTGNQGAGDITDFMEFFVEGGTNAGDFATTGTLAGKLVVTTLAGSRLLTAAELSGGSIIATGAHEAELPAASCDSATGAKFTITASAGNKIEIAVEGAEDTINIEGAALGADDELDSAGGAFDSVTIECLATNNWYVTAEQGVWVDGGVAD